MVAAGYRAGALYGGAAPWIRCRHSTPSAGLPPGLTASVSVCTFSLEEELWVVGGQGEQGGRVEEKNICDNQWRRSSKESERIKSRFNTHTVPLSLHSGSSDSCGESSLWRGGGRVVHCAVPSCEAA